MNPKDITVKIKLDKDKEIEIYHIDYNVPENFSDNEFIKAQLSKQIAKENLINEIYNNREYIQYVDSAHYILYNIQEINSSNKRDIFEKNLLINNKIIVSLSESINTTYITMWFQYNKNTSIDEILNDISIQVSENLHWESFNEFRTICKMSWRCARAENEYTTRLQYKHEYDQGLDIVLTEIEYKDTKSNVIEFQF